MTARGHTYVKISYGAEELTHFGGALLLQQFFRRLGLRTLLAEAVQADWRNARYSISDMVLAVVYPIVLGLGRLETSSWMGHNGVFKYLSGLERYPDPTVLRRFLSRLGEGRTLRRFEALHDRLRVGFLGQPASVTFDLDATVLPVYGHQKGARVGFNPTKRGRPSYLPQVCVEGATHDCWAGRLLPGNAPAIQDVQAMMEHTLGQLPPSVKRVRVRGDAAFYDGKFMSYLDGRQVGYAIPAWMTKRLIHRFGGLVYRVYRDQTETGELDYPGYDWGCSRRIVVIRRPIREEPSWQMTLFRLGAYTYQAIVTNLDLEALNLWRFYNARSRIELAIREWKHGWPLGKMPRHDGRANAAWFHLVMFAFNLLNWFKRSCVEGALANATIPTLRQCLLNVPAALVRPQGMPVLKLPAGYPYRAEFEAAFQRTRRFHVPAFPRTKTEPWFTKVFDDA